MQTINHNQFQSPIICIGGANVDRKFYAKQDLMNETSNPITSLITVGGVARNIAENLGRLGEKVDFISVRGKDSEWLEISKASDPYVDLTNVVTIAGASTGSYTAVLNKNGDMTIAYADMDIFDEITPSLLKEKESLLKLAKCIIVDLNCPGETIEYLMEFTKEFNIPFIIIPVSSPKMNRLPKKISHLTWLIVNKDETETFFNLSINSDETWKQSVEKWLSLGVKNVIVTNGSKGVMAGSDEYNIQHFPSILTKDVIDVTGAGDSFCSAVIYSWLQNLDFQEVIHAGLVNAHKTILSKHTVRKELTANQLKKDMEELF